MSPRRRRKNPAHCPCGSRRVYTDCCAPYHRGEAVPETPQTLVRSRYCAYARQLVDYIIDTTDPDGAAWQEPIDQWRKDIANFGQKMQFSGVEILSAEVDENRATVTFRATLRRRRRDASFTEVSQFVRRAGRWLYSEGQPQR